MPPEIVTGRDIELVTIGIGSIVAGIWFGLHSYPPEWTPLILLMAIGGLSIGVAVWDIRTRDVYPRRSDGDE